MIYVVDWIVGGTIFALRQILRLRYAILFAVVAGGAVTLSRAFPASQLGSYWVMAVVLFFLFLFVDGLGSGQKAPFYWNFDAAKRRDRIAELIGSCQKSLLIVSGEFFHEVFESPLVLHALDKLPSDVRVELYITESAVDVESKLFQKWASSRGADIKRIDKTIAHRIVVDDLNVRIEFRHTGVIGKGRPAMVVYGEPKVASEARKAVYRAMETN